MKEGIIMSETAKAIIDNMLDQLVALQESMEKEDAFSNKNKARPEKVEMLTIKESADLISGLSEHTVRKLVAQGKVKSVRTGEGERGKILVNKADLIEYFSRKDK